MSIKVFIQGSCVTRDAFPFSEGYDIVHYGARSSLATLASNKINANYDLSSISSDFQRRMLVDDHNRNLLANIEDKDFDIFILDFIDERDGLINIDGNGFVTNLPEFRSLDLEKQSSQVLKIEPRSDELFNLFCSGFDRLYSKLVEINKQDCCCINQVYWAKIKDDGTKIYGNTDYIDEENKFLEKIYNYIRQNYSDVRFMTYESSKLIANSKHKWGLTPFHYVDDVYKTFLSNLEKKLASLVYIIDITQNKFRDNLFFAGIIDSNLNLEYAAYLYKNGEKIDDIFYQSMPIFKFKYDGDGDYMIRLFCRVKGTNIKNTQYSVPIKF
ncbi:DUF6270 domain-containing protein [Acinetobacter rudis]|uniref:Uncharacterized protein n=1 Tax=Acinetobacter rudis CIP 110305 TaxID=421052 RepID=S3NYA4_9GAMM|nr:DUF6270 domain-containing protein [Acinetobacter rudis]EPF71606.1 hypothetical protein F945_02639 [Acinetobacter rudis CIP 110305]